MDSHTTHSGCVKSYLKNIQEIPTPCLVAVQSVSSRHTAWESFSSQDQICWDNSVLFFSTTPIRWAQRGRIALHLQWGIENTKCSCCNMGHVDEDGMPLICDTWKEWFWNLQSFLGGRQMQKEGFQQAKNKLLLYFKARTSTFQYLLKSIGLLQFTLPRFIPTFLWVKCHGSKRCKGSTTESTVVTEHVGEAWHQKTWSRLWNDAVASIEQFLDLATQLHLISSGSTHVILIVWPFGLRIEKLYKSASAFGLEINVVSKHLSKRKLWRLHLYRLSGSDLIEVVYTNPWFERASGSCLH